MDHFIVLAKDFVPNESAVIDIKSTRYIDTLGTLEFQNNTGQVAEFHWQGDIIPENREQAGYFKEMMNDLGIKVNHYDGFITVTNGGGSQYLEGKLKI
ncbi:hypothetical protein [Chryseobacterium sp. Mn2064]|uniref:hypothetical protein n=1 Tax=Chryseobacterium sp. Mn2064 TaxID=3395263 RepID=UPI003BE7CCFA